MKKFYQHTFRDGVTAEMTVDFPANATDEIVVVVWKPTFNPAFLASVLPEYTTWVQASLLDYGLMLGRKIERTSI